MQAASTAAERLTRDYISKYKVVYHPLPNDSPNYPEWAAAIAAVVAKYNWKKDHFVPGNRHLAVVPVEGVVVPVCPGHDCALVPRKTAGELGCPQMPSKGSLQDPNCSYIVHADVGRYIVKNYKRDNAEAAAKAKVMASSALSKFASLKKLPAAAASSGRAAAVTALSRAPSSGHQSAKAKPVPAVAPPSPAVARVSGKKRSAPAQSAASPAPAATTAASSGGKRLKKASSAASRSGSD